SPVKSGSLPPHYRESPQRSGAFPSDVMGVSRAESAQTHASCSRMLTTSQDYLLGKQWLLSVGQNVDCDQGGGEARNRANTERPARTELVGHPTDDRSANRCSPECHANPQRHHPAPHRWFC